MANKTIAAISTPSGEGGIGVIRISGDDAFKIADKVFVSVSGKKIADIKGYTALFGGIYENGEKIDTAVALKFVSPKSYTGENTVEFYLHGGNFLLKKALRFVLSSGADTAENGEFTKRAFLNGKMDLTEAESIMSLISAQTEDQLKIAGNAANGKIFAAIKEIEAELLKTASFIGAYNDYPDEDLDGLSLEGISASLKTAETSLNRLITDFDNGRIIREGITAAIVGKPNVGKSTLMNLLTGVERSIVTDIAGTTRDVIEDSIVLDGIKISLSDTAGIHATEDIIEKLGVDKTVNRINSSSLIIALFDASRPLDADDLNLLKLIKNKVCMAVINKTDLESKIDKTAFDNLPTVEMSARNKTGIKDFTKVLKEVTKLNSLSPDAVMLITERQYGLAQKTYSTVSQAVTALESGVTADAVSVLVNDAIAYLYSLTGERVTDAVTNEIFSRFCVGK